MQYYGAHSATPITLELATSIQRKSVSSNSISLRSSQEKYGGNKTFDPRKTERYYFRNINLDRDRWRGNSFRRSSNSYRSGNFGSLDVSGYLAEYTARGRKCAFATLRLTRADGSKERKHYTTIAVVERLSLGKLSARSERDAAGGFETSVLPRKHP